MVDALSKAELLLDACSLGADVVDAPSPNLILPSKPFNCVPVSCEVVDGCIPSNEVVLGLDAPIEASVVDASCATIDATTVDPKLCHEDASIDPGQVVAPLKHCSSDNVQSLDPFNTVDASTLALMHKACVTDASQVIPLLEQPLLDEIGRRRSVVGSRKFTRQTSTSMVDADAVYPPADL